MTVLHFGVAEMPYATLVPKSSYRVAVRTKRGGKPQKISAAPSGGQTTGDVAEILESRYHVMEVFWELHQDGIIAAFEKTMIGAIENLGMGAPAGNNALAEAESDIETQFKKFISNKEMDGIQPGVPTKASLKGVNHRLAHPYAKGNPVRASFRDTGLYEQSFKAWMTD
jgi:hypothetical protein